ncbi:MAG TPA: FAD:protein FMN transferase [Armatimonadota bacterium]|jgi:thiamine biosynthesis lipoprotein
MLALGRYLMGTRFELVLGGGADPGRLRSVGEAALDEVERIEGLLSIYRPESEAARVNSHAAEGWVRVHPDVFTLFQRCQALSRATDGAFDITVLPMLRAWGFIGASGHAAGAGEIAAARAVTGIRHISLDAETSSVRFDSPGVGLDLGAIGKGYALDAAADILRDMGVRSALMHGGTSTVIALGSSDNSEGWNIAIRDPGSEDGVLRSVTITDGQALSVSAVHGKAFTSDDGRLLGHVLDPRTGSPCERARLAAVVTDNATDADALSTALLVLGEAEAATLPCFAPLFPDAAFVVPCEPQTLSAASHSLSPAH